MPLPEQSLPILFKHLIEKEGVSTVLAMAYGTEEGIRQKGLAESLAIEEGLDFVKVSLFVISEETFSLDLKADKLQHQVERVVAAAPDAVILTGSPPHPFSVLVDHLRRGGYTGLICAQNSQDPRLLGELGAVADGVFYVGGHAPDEARSQYFESLKARYLDLADEWSEEAETKLYALEFILACLRHAGPYALEETSVLYGTLAGIQFEDPFFEERRMIQVTGGIEENEPWQILIPVRISKMSGGEPFLVEESHRAI
jgi:branched-chain amino acid transport system substrate-binding protein